MKIVFYLENKNIKEIDLSQPELGNPGCGGTEYLFVAFPFYLDKFKSNEYQTVILANHIDNLPKEIEHHQVSDEYEAVCHAHKLQSDFFIYRPKRDKNIKLLRLIDELKLNSIAWFHITPKDNHLRLLSKTKYIKAGVCVEHEQYDQAQDSAIWRKLTYIVNGFDVENFKLNKEVKKESGLVVYIGALVIQKGFHLLANVWKDVLKRCPNAKLAVIGTGAVYDHSQKLGHWQVAEEAYENEYLIPFLSDKNGGPHHSVNFLGRLGNEKKEWLAKAIVGVPNPTGSSENCPGSALEIQALGTGVVSGAYLGMLDTIVDKKTGLLGRSKKDLVDNICQLLEDENKANSLGEQGVNFVKSRYAWQKVVSDWDKLFIRLSKNKKPQKFYFKSNLHRHYKFFIMINRYFQIVFGFIFWPSTVEIKIFIKKMLKKCTN